MSQSEPFPGTTKTRDDFICNEENFMPVTDRPDQWKIICGRNDHPTYAHDRFSNERGNRVLPFTQNGFFERTGSRLPHGFPILHFAFIAIGIWRWDMNESFNCGPKHDVIFFQPGCEG